MTRPLLAIFIALLVAGCSSLKFWGDDSASEQESEIEDQKTTSADGKPAKLEKIEQRVKIDRLWSAGLGASQEAFEASLRPAVEGGTVYAASREGRVVAVDAESGKRRWRKDLDIGLTGGVGIGAGLVLVGTAMGDLIALDAQSGEQAWQVALSSEILSPAAASEDLVVVQTQDAKIYGLAAADGSRRWLFEMDLPVLTLRGTAVPQIAESLVLVAFANGKLVALDTSTGIPRWEVRVAMPAGRTELERMVDANTPVLEGDIIYAVTYQGRVGAFTRGSGRELWARDMSSPRAPAVSMNQVYIVDADDRVVALRATGGQELWSNTALRRRVPTAPLVVGDLVAVADGEGYLHLLSAVDGSFVGRRKVDSDGVSVPMVTDGERIFVQDNGGDLTAYEVRGSVSGKAAADGDE